MEIKNMTIDEMISHLDFACGKLLIASMRDNEIKEAMEMIMEVSISLGEMGCDSVEVIEEDGEEEIILSYPDSAFTEYGARY